MGELLARIDDVRFERAEMARLAPDDLKVLPRLSEVDGQSHYLGAVLILDPLQHHARVEAAAVEEQHAMDMFWIGFVGGGLAGDWFEHGAEAYWDQFSSRRRLTSHHRAS